DVPCAVGRHSARRIHLRTGGWAVVAGVTQQTVAGNRADVAARDLADAIVQRVRNINIARRIDRQACGRAELGVGRRTAIAGEARRAVSRDGADIAFAIDLTDTAVAVLRKINIARAINAQRERRDQSRLGRGAVITRKTHRCAPGDSVDVAVGGDFAYARV